MRLLLTSFFLFMGSSLVWAAPNNTMSVTPTCTSGTTILCSDETTRNNNISTPYNAHTHTDISAMSGVNTFTIGDGTNGNKDYCVDSTTDRCLRWNESVGLWTLQQNGSTYNEVVTFSSTAGITSGAVLGANGTGSIVGLTTTTPSDDAALVGDSTSAATWRSLPNCTDTSGNHLNYTQSSNTFSCGTSSGLTTIVKTSNESVNNSTTLQDDDQLFTAVAANERVNFLLVGFQNSTTVADLKIGFTVPAGSSLEWGSPSGIVADTGLAFATQTTVTSSGGSVSVGGTGGRTAVTLMGYVSTAGTSGNLTLQFAQNTAEATNTQMLSGSYLVVWR